MTTLYLILFIFAAIGFALEAFTNVHVSRVNLVAAGLFFWVLVFVFRTVDTL